MPGSSARPRRSRARTPTARRRRRSSTPSAARSTRRSTGVDPLRIELVAERCATWPATTSRAAPSTSPSGTWSARSSRLPCHTLLGGFADDVAAAHMVSLGEPAEMADDAVEVNERLGVTTFKVKVGRAPALDVAAVRAVREALPDADLYVDANRGWSYDDAVRAGDELAELGVRAIEEPISVEDRAGRLRLAERWAVPLAGDESCISLAHVDRALEEGAVRHGEHQDRADRVHGVAPDPRSLPRAQRRRRRRQPVRGRDRRDRRRSRSPPRSPRPPASRPRSRTSSTSPTISSSPGRRSATAARRCRRRRASASRSTRSACSATGWTADAVPVPRWRSASRPTCRPSRPRSSRRASASTRRRAQRDGRWPHLWRVAGRYANVSVLDVELGRRAARAAVRPSAVPLSGHPRHAAGAPPQRHRPRRERCLIAPTN